MAFETTIAAISSPPGGARRGVIRISGPGTAAVLQRTCRVGGRPLDAGPRGAFEATFDDGLGEQPALVLWMPGPRSFTREDVAELHLPGAPALLSCALERVLACGAQAAAPGEFTRRAFENGRIDLTRAEGVLALVSARNQQEQRAASALLFGGLGERMDRLRDELDALRALCEASLDFDEADTGHVPTSELAASLERVRTGLEETLRYEDRRAGPSGEARVALVGEPNAGKSSLFNRLAGSKEAADRALVSDVAGTTRDAKGASWRVGEIECGLLDTAGFDEPSGSEDVGGVHRDGESASLADRAQDRSWRAAEQADLLLWVVDGSSDPPRPVEFRRGDSVRASSASESRVASQRSRQGEQVAPVGLADAIVVWNKLDAPGARPAPQRTDFRGLRVLDVVPTSAESGAGLDRLEAAVASFLNPERPQSARPVGLGRELHARHRRALVQALEEVRNGADGLEGGEPLDLVAEALRAATDELDRIRGRTTPETLLDRIFAQFCLGK